MAFRLRSESSAAVREYKAAKAAQDRLQKSQQRRGVTDETPAYLKANRRTLNAEQKVSWFRR